MFSWVYGVITDFRNTLYEKKIYKSFSLGAKTVSVGNITVGGTGKTPLVAFVAEILAEKGEKVCILTRGYGRKNPKKRVAVSDGEKVLASVKEASDEPVELAQKLLGKAIVIADPDRVAAAKWARQKFGATAFVLDDAFQHRRAKRDLDIVVVDATNPFGNYKTLPSGTLRESLSNLKRADLIVISRSNLVRNTEDTKRKIKEFNSECPIFICENSISALIELETFGANEHKDAREENKSQKNSNERRLKINADELSILNSKLKSKKTLAFCALGNPNNFYEQLRRENYNLVAIESFPDHHFYTQKDIEKIETRAALNGAKILLTTAKDGVKLKNLRFDTSCYIVETELCFEDENGFRKILESLWK